MAEKKSQPDWSGISQRLIDALATHSRIGVTGGPRCGKTTLCELVTDRPVIHTDDFKHLEWADVPAAVIAACAGLESFVVEGVMVPRSLRKGLDVDVLLVLNKPFETVSKGQAAMAKGVATVLKDWAGKPVVLS